MQYLLNRAERAREAAAAPAAPNAAGSNVEEDAVAGHLRGLKDTTVLKLTRNPAYKDQAANASTSLALDSSSSPTFPFVCQLTGKELNDRHRCVYLRPCGCAFVESGLRAICSETSAAASSSSATASDDIRQCPSCATNFHAGVSLIKAKSIDVLNDPKCDVFVLNPTPKEREKMRLDMMAARETEAAAKKAKKEAADQAEGGTADDSEEAVAKRKRKADKKAAKLEQVRALQAQLDAPATKRQKVDSDAEGSILQSANRVASEAKRAAQGKPYSPAIAAMYGPKARANSAS